MPAFIFSILFITGILIGSQYLFSSAGLSAIIIFTASVTLIIFKNGNFRTLASLLTGLLIILFGIYKSNIDFFHTSGNSISLFPDTDRSSNITLTGVISELPESDTNRIRFVLESRKFINGSDTFIVSGDVMTEVRKNIFEQKNIPQRFLKPVILFLLKENYLKLPGREIRESLITECICRSIIFIRHLARTDMRMLK